MRLIHDQIQYIEFLSRDLAKVKEFYGKAFGWNFTDYGETYTAFEGKYVDGGFEIGNPVNGSILIILYSDNLFETKNKVVEAGGLIRQDIFPFPGGKRFCFTDPDGNELAVWSNK